MRNSSVTSEDSTVLATVPTTATSHAASAEDIITRSIESVLSIGGCTAACPVVVPPVGVGVQSKGGGGMASFMTKKKKYKFHVDVCLEELVEVPFVSAVLFAKLRLLDGGSFQDTSSRQEVVDHRVHWNASFTFPCKMMANASTGVMERCVLRVSVRKESKGGRSFTKLGFVDLNLAEYAGAGVVRKKALLEGYDARRRQDNSMLKFKIELSMVSGDILFKAPSPSLKHKQITVDEGAPDQRSEEFSSGSLAGSIASGSSGFGSLPKKRPALLSSDLVIGQTLPESNVPATISSDLSSVEPPPPPHQTSGGTEVQQDPQQLTNNSCELGHSRNSSNTSQLSKASGYSSSVQTHSRQSSSGDSGHVRDPRSRSVRMRSNPSTSLGAFFRTNTYPKKINIPNTIPSNSEMYPSTRNDTSKLRTPPCTNEIFSTPLSSTPSNVNQDGEISFYSTPKGFQAQLSVDDSYNDEYVTPDTSATDVFSQNFIELQKSSSTSVVERIKNNLLTARDVQNRKSDSSCQKSSSIDDVNAVEQLNERNIERTVSRSKSEFQIPKVPALPPEKPLTARLFNSNSLISFLTPRLKRKRFGVTAKAPPNFLQLPLPSSVSQQTLKSLPESRAASMSSLRSSYSGDNAANDVQRNPSAGSLSLSETGSLDRGKYSYEKRKALAPSAGKKEDQDGCASSGAGVSGRVEITRVNPDDLIEELLKSTNLETDQDESAETSGLQLFIAKDGTAAVGNHEVKSQMQTGGVQIFKQVVMDDNR